jgi:hypothetical protein
MPGPSYFVSGIRYKAGSIMNPLAKAVLFLMFSAAAALVAFCLAYVSRNEFGISPPAIRTAAFIASGLLVIALYGNRPGKTK